MEGTRSGLPLLAACVAVAIGVIAVRFHYFTDTVAGAAVGIGTVCGLALILDVVQPGSVAARWRTFPDP